MRKELLPIAALGAWACTLPVLADELTVPPAPAAAAISLPAKGTTMAAIEKQFGAPSKRYPTVGGGSPRQPPITRWDYPGFTVVFEHDKVVDAVIPGAPPRLSTRQGLQPTDVPMPAPTVESTPDAAPEATMPAASDAPVATEAPVADAPVEMTPATDAAPMGEAAPMADEAPAQGQDTTVGYTPPTADSANDAQPAETTESPDASDEPQPLP